LNKHRSTTISRFYFTLMLLLAGLVLTLAGVARAQDADPPSRVARLNFIEGSVSFQPAGTSDWLDANPNRPLTTGDQLWADQGSRGELHLGGSVLRISAQTAVSFLNLADQAVQIQIAQGSADLRVLHLEDNENYEIDTPNLAFSILRPGEYRVDVNADGTSSIVTVETGTGEVTAGGQAYNVAAGQQYTFSGTDEVSYDAGAVPDPDDFQKWNLQRDQREDHFASAQYVSRDVIGYEDLDEHGTWRDDATYGHVWIPNGVAVGWAPYHNGHWAFVAPWGWTWVEDEPWGFAPFHYGRWAVVGGGWGWVPGPAPVVGAVFIRPVYAPALVAFVGGGGLAASIEIGGAAGVGVAWFPLGPRDVWVPSYHVSAAYMTNVNVTNSRVINRTEITTVYNTTVVNRSSNVAVNRTYMYQSSPGAVTAVSKTAFQNGEPVAKAAVQVNAQEIQHARVVQTAAIAPTPRAVAGPSAAAKPSARPPVTLASRPVVTKMAPSARAIPVGQTKPAAASTYKSMANAKPATSQPPARTAAPANRPAQPSAARPPAAQPNNPSAAPVARPAPAEKPAERANEPPARTNEPPAHENQPPARTNEASPANKATPPVRENQPPERKNEVPANKPAPPPARTQPPARENPPAARTTEAPTEKPAPKTTPPPAHENAPPARTTETPTEKPTPKTTPPPAHENAPKQTPPVEAKPAPRQPAPEAKKPNPPPPAKETKPPTKEQKDKDKEKEKEPPH
jgi:FecR protein